MTKENMGLHFATFKTRRRTFKGRIEICTSEVQNMALIMKTTSLEIRRREIRKNQSLQERNIVTSMLGNLLPNQPSET
jgi:hypothetical protein